MTNKKLVENEDLNRASPEIEDENSNGPKKSKKKKNFFVRHNKLLTGLGGLLLGVASLIVAITALLQTERQSEIFVEQLRISEETANTNERIQKMQLVSKMEFDFGDTGNGKRDKNGQGYFYISFQNTGSGPALIKWFRVFYKGNEINDWNKLYELIYADLDKENRPNVNPDIKFGVPGINSFEQPISENTGTGYLLREYEKDWRDILLSTSKNFQLIACFCHVYGECEKTGWARSIPDNVNQIYENSTCAYNLQYEKTFRTPDSFWDRLDVDE